jgi:hypothetical protein
MCPQWQKEHWSILPCRCLLWQTSPWCCPYIKLSLICLWLIWIKTLKILLTLEQILQKTQAFRKADESFFWILEQVQLLWIFHWWITVIVFLQFSKKGLTALFYLFIFMSATSIVEFSVHLCSKFLTFWGYFLCH